MTVSETEEMEPLLPDPNGSRAKVHSTLTEKDPTELQANGYGTNLYLEKIPNPYSMSYGSDGSSGSGSPDVPPASFLDRQQSITYTWHEIDVHATGVESGRNRLCRHWRNFTGSGKKIPPAQPKHILHKVNGVAYPGELIALMGASGAGKTSLLNVLTFRNSDKVHVSGVRAVNGVPVTSNQLTSISAYVQQDDLFIGTLTVREHLIFQALVRMDRHISYSQRMLRVEQVISELALTKCQNTVIGIPGRIKGISGGEMKRLSFASEVLTDPPLMFCDEPTSGLDSFMAQNVVSVLKNMALKGKTVIVTIHQPSSEVFAMFDKVLLLAEGRVAYLGTSQNACDFFKQLGAACPTNYNPADFFIQLLAVVPNREEACRETIELVCDAFGQSDEGLQLAATTEFHPQFQIKGGWNKFDVWDDTSDRTPSPYKASWVAQFRAVLWRSWLSVIKEPMLIKVRLLQTVLVAGIISIIYYHQALTQDGVMNINGVLFIFLTNMTFQNVFAVINVFCAEMPVFMREHFNGMYRVDVYFLCKTLAEVPIFLAIPVIFTSITYFSIGLYPAFSHFLTTTFIIILVANVATSFGYLISCVSTGVTMALSIGPPVVIPFLLFGGFFLNSASVPPYFKWLSYLSWFKYGNEALLINQWADVDFIDCTQSNSTCPKNGHVVLETLNFQESNFPLDIFSLIVLIILFRVFAYLALTFRVLRND